MEEKLRKLQAMSLLYTALQGTPFTVDSLKISNDLLSGSDVIDIRLMYAPAEMQQPAPAEKLSTEGFVDAILQTGGDLLQQNGTQTPKRRGRKPTLHATLHVEPAQPDVKPHAPTPRRVTAPKLPPLGAEEDIDLLLDDE